MPAWHQRILGRGQHSEQLIKDKLIKGTDQHRVREANRLLVLNYIRERSTVPRAELAPYTGLSRTAIGNIVDELVQEGIIKQEEHHSGSDRRTILLSFNATASYVLGATLGHQHLTVLLANLAGESIQHLEIPFSTSKGPEEGLPLLSKFLKVFAAEQQVAWEMIAGLGLGIISPLDLLPQRTPMPVSFARWAGANIQRALEKDLDIPVYLDNDGNMGALGESQYGAGRNEESMLYVKVGSSISGGLVLNRQVYRGDVGTAGAIGHIPVEFDGVPCHCGRSGCLETVAGKEGILRIARRSLPTLTTISQVIEAAKREDPMCMTALTRAGNYLGFVLAGLVNTLNPALIVLDGSTIMQARDLMLPSLLATLEAHSLPLAFSHLHVTLAECNGLAMPLGGVATILDALF